MRSEPAGDCILPAGVHRIDTALGERLSSLFLFVGRERAVLFDTGVNGTIPEYVVPYARSIGLPLAMIEVVVVSHCDVDHFGGLQDVHDFLPRAEVVAHDLDAPAMENFSVYERMRGRSFLSDFDFDEGTEGIDWARSVVRVGTVDRWIRSEEEVNLGGRVIRILHTPGHSRGHLSVYDPSNKFIAIADAILGNGVPLASGKPAFPPTYRHERDYLHTIERVRSLAVEQLGTAHYGCFCSDEVALFLDLSVAFARDLKAQVKERIGRSDTGMTLRQLLEELNPFVGDWPKADSLSALAFPVVAHIEGLEQEGLSRRSRRDGTVMLESFDNP